MKWRIDQALAECYRLTENWVARLATALREPAIEVYRKLERPEEPEGSCWQLAQKRLVELAPAMTPKNGKRSKK